MLTHMHNGGGHLVVFTHLQRRWSSYGKEGFGFLSPSRLGGIRRFWENKMHIFYYAGRSF